MPAPFNPPVKGEDFQVIIQLEDFASPGRFKANPTIAAGDFQISKDGGAFANLATLPVVSPALGRSILIALSAAEMTADVVTVQCVDQTATAEWSDYSLTILTTTP